MSMRVYRALWHKFPTCVHDVLEKSGFKSLINLIYLLLFYEVEIINVFAYFSRLF